MALDVGGAIGFAVILAFFGAVVWLEIHSRRQRRRKLNEEGCGAAKRTEEEGSGERSRKR